MKVSATKIDKTATQSPLNGTQALELYFAQIDRNLRDLKEQFSLLPAKFTEMSGLMKTQLFVNITELTYIECGPRLEGRDEALSAAL